MDHNNILAVVLAGGKSKRFGRDKSQVKLGNKILIDYILTEIVDFYKDILIVTNEPIKFLDSNKISVANDIKKGNLTPIPKPKDSPPNIIYLFVFFLIF